MMAAGSGQAGKNYKDATREAGAGKRAHVAGYHSAARSRKPSTGRHLASEKVSVSAQSSRGLSVFHSPDHARIRRGAPQTETHEADPSGRRAYECALPLHRPLPENSQAS